MKKLLFSLSFRIILLTAMVMALVGLSLHTFVLSTISDFVLHDIGNDLRSSADSIFVDINTRYTALSETTAPGAEAREREAQALALRHIRHVLSRDRLNGAVFSSKGGKILLREGLDQRTMLSVPDNMARNLVVRESEGQTVYLYAFEFGPWGWNMVLAGSQARYSKLTAQVKRAHLAAWLALCAAVVLLFIVLRRAMNRPLRAIMDRIATDDPPDYKGIHEFEYLSAHIAGMMGSLDEKSDFIRNLFESLSALIVVLDQDRRIRMLNPKAEKMFGKTEEDSLGRPCKEVLPGGCIEPAGSGPGIMGQNEVTFHDASGREVTVLWTEAVLARPDGTEYRRILTGLDITARRRAQTELSRQRAFFQQLFDRSPLAIAVVDSKGGVINVNKGFESLFGYTCHQVEGQDLDELITTPDMLDEARDLAMKARSGQGVSTETVRRRKNGEMVHVNLLGVPVKVDEEEAGIYAIYNDITARVLAENELKHQARHDFLTNLPNRAIFLERIKGSMARVARHEGFNCAVLFLDLDKFKNINDTYGHKAGDELLVSLARRLQACVRDVDTVARFGGDEFAVLLDDASDVRRVVMVMDRIMEETSKPFILDGNEVLTGISIGAVTDIRAYDNPGQILSDADIALYRAKQGGRGQYVIFDSSMHDEAARITQLETDLKGAMERDEFSLNFQPIVDMESGDVSGFEALLRWKHPEQGMVLPTVFLNTAEETGLIQPIDYWVVGTACPLLAKWKADHDLAPDLSVNVNLSPKNFYRADLSSQIQHILTESGMPPNALRLEIGEDLLMEDPDYSATLLARLHNIGVGLVIDDFGLGVSAMGDLHRFPVDMIKLHQSFVQTLAQRLQSREVARAMISLAANLDIQASAKGVETMEQRDILMEMGCPLAQGFYYHKPMPPEDIEAMLKATGGKGRRA